jgi:hypothetical protein
MTGVENDGSKDRATDGAAPVNSFRRGVELRVKVLRSLRNPTVEQIERALFWEEYLRLGTPEARAMQEPAGEPIQRR